VKTALPPELEATLPKSTWGRILSATPVVMTVVATLLAGLASSEMTHAQYDRSLATQQQSKAGDQWSFFQAKRLRSAMQQGTLDALEFSTPSFPQQGPALASALRSLTSSSASTTAEHPEIEALATGQLPEVTPARFDPALQAAVDAVATQRSENEINGLVAQVSDATLAAAVLEAKAVVTRLDDTLKPILQGIERMQRALAEAAQSPAGAKEGGAATMTAPSGLKQDFVAARLRFTIRRYEAEARLNQTLANLYEVLVRKSNLSAERHHARSQRFFYGMLAAQLSVIMSTFATAVRMRSTLWTLAAVAGVFAVALAAYVYLME